MKEESRILKDEDIREPLFDYLEGTYAKIRILEEKQMGKSRADVVMVLPEELVGIEIKSDADTYTRLSRQVKDYNRFFDRNYVVVGTTHAKQVHKHVPDFWGIITVELVNERYADFYVLREAMKNPKAKLIRKMEFLWKAELSLLLAQAKMPKYTNKSKKFIREKLIEKIDEDTLHKWVSEVLFERDYTTMQEERD